MNRVLFWRLCLVLAVGMISLFYVINMITSRTEDGMSYIEPSYQQEILEWASIAEELYRKGDSKALESWIKQLGQQEGTWVGLVETEARSIGGTVIHPRLNDGVMLGRDVSWKIHLYFADNPIMEVTFSDNTRRFLIELPDRMRPGTYLAYINLALQILLPLMLLIPLSFVIYNHIMSPVKQLERATRQISKGDFNIRTSSELGGRKDEFAQLAKAFDSMASLTGDLIDRQRQLISDLSHELRTPLARLDIAINSIEKNPDNSSGLERVNRESLHIRKLVEDTLTLAWLENEGSNLLSQQKETLDLVDLIDVLQSDAQFEFPDRTITSNLLDSAIIRNSNHRAVGQALENVIRNACRYTPTGKSVSLGLSDQEGSYLVRITDSGPGVATEYLTKIFQPFYRVNNAHGSSDGFGLGLALAKRQLESVNATIIAHNAATQGLIMEVEIPK